MGNSQPQQPTYPQQPQQQWAPPPPQPMPQQPVPQQPAGTASPTSDGLLVQVRDLTVTVPNRDRIGTKTLLDHVSVDFRPGEVTALIGPSGCGKSTLLKAICGVHQADKPKDAASGVFLGGHPYYKEMGELSHRIAYLPQMDSEWMHEELSAVDEVDYTWRLRETGRSETDAHDKAARRGEIRSHFRRRGLLEHYKNPISTLSGGQKKLVATIESRAANPELLLLDEPTAPLDPGSSAEFVADLVEQAHEESLTTIMVTHDPIALRGLGDTCHVILMRKGGTIAFDGTYDRLATMLRSYYEPKTKRTLTVDDAIQELFKDFAQGLIPSFMEEGDTDDDIPDSLSDVTLRASTEPIVPVTLPPIHPTGFFSQLWILLRRETSLLVGKGLSSLTLLLIPLVLGAILGGVAKASGGTSLYQTYAMTQAMMFSLSACAFFVGVFDSIGSFTQKRRTKIEELHGMRSLPYVLAVGIVMTLLVLVQSILLFATFTASAGVPDSFMYDARFDMLVTTFLCAWSATTLGMLCSSIFKHSTYVAPVLVIIQIVFSGMIFALDGITKKISMGISCHWAMNALAALCDLNHLPTYINMSKVGLVPVTYTNAEFATEKFTLFTSWMMLSLIGIVSLVLCALVMACSRRLLFHPDFLGARTIGNALGSAKQVVGMVAAPLCGVIAIVAIVVAVRTNPGLLDPANLARAVGDFLKYLGTLLSDLPEFVSQLLEKGM